MRRCEKSYAARKYCRIGILTVTTLGDISLMLRTRRTGRVCG
jgi:hypothetical protein